MTIRVEKAPSDASIDSSRRLASAREAIDGLPLLCRAIFMLRKVHRLSQAEIAEVFGLSCREVEQYAAEGLMHCQNRLRGMERAAPMASDSPSD